MRTLQVNRIGLVAAVLLAAACSSPSFHHSAADANGDGKISLGEMSDLITREVFESSDTNRDGFVSFSEWRVVAPRLDAGRFRKRDGDGDGKVTLEEAIAATREQKTWYPLMEGLDDNADRVIDVEEAREFLREKTE